MLTPDVKKTRHESNYGRKHVWLSRHGLWGFEVPEPKPWRGSAEGGAGSSFRENRPCRYAAEVQAKIIDIAAAQDEQARRRAEAVRT